MRATTVRVDESLWERLETERGSTSRNRFIVEAIEAKLGLAASSRPPGRPRGGSGLSQQVAPPNPLVNSGEEGSLLRRNGLLWADVDDPPQRLAAQMLVAGADRNDDPPVIPYRSSQGEDPANAQIERLDTTEQLWGYVDQVFAGLST